MKTGDIVICTQDYILNSSKYHKGTKYTIQFDNSFANTTNTKMYKLVRIKDIYFFLDKNDLKDRKNLMKSSPYFYDYFIDIKKERKQKLDKINSL